MQVTNAALQATSSFYAHCSFAPFVTQEVCQNMSGDAVKFSFHPRFLSERLLQVYVPSDVSFLLESSECDLR